MVAYHLSRLVNEEATIKEAEIEDELPDESLFLIAERSWFADIANFKVAGIIPKDLTWQLSYPNFVRGPSVVGMRPSFDHFEVLGTHR